MRREPDVEALRASLMRANRAALRARLGGDLRKAARLQREAAAAAAVLRGVA